MNRYFPYADEPDIPFIKFCIGVITLYLWGFGIYYFGIEAYTSGWENGQTAILDLWIIFAGPLIFGGLVLIFRFLSDLISLCLSPFTNK